MNGYRKTDESETVDTQANRMTTRLDSRVSDRTMRGGMDPTT